MKTIAPDLRQKFDLKPIPFSPQLDVWASKQGSLLKYETDIVTSPPILNLKSKRVRCCFCF